MQTKAKSAQVPGNVYYEEKQMLKESADAGTYAISTTTANPSVLSRGHSEEVTGLVVDITNSILVSCSLDGRLIFWSFDGHTVIKEINVGKPLTMLIAQKEAGFVAVGGLDAVIRVYDINTHALGRRFSHDHFHSKAAGEAVQVQPKRFIIIN